MGVPKKQWVEEELASLGQGAHCEQGGRPSSDAYPPEKAGWHARQDEPSTTSEPWSNSAAAAGSTTPWACSGKPEPLDVSRLVTLPPPYPRHHPAVNNNQPELAEVRRSVRVLSDLTEVDQAKERFAAASSKRRDAFSQAASERQRSLRANLQKEIGAGNLGYADAAAIEADSHGLEKDKKKELEKTEYEHFQNEMVLPLNEVHLAHDGLVRRAVTGRV